MGGRVAMAGFVGYCVHANDIRFPFNSIAMATPKGLSPQELWDVMPEAGKWQIILTIGFFEFWRENAAVLKGDGTVHYMRGGKPGYFPTFDMLPHPVPYNLYDPFGWSAGASDEKKAKGLLAEVNNGRLAMIGLMGFLTEAKVPGSVPALTGLVKPYAGDVMAPFAADFHLLPQYQPAHEPYIELDRYYIPLLASTSPPHPPPTYAHSFMRPVQHHSCVGRWHAHCLLQVGLGVVLMVVVVVSCVVGRGKGSSGLLFRARAREAHTTVGSSHARGKNTRLIV